MISARGLCKSFGDNLVLDRVSLDISAGELVYLVGRSGMGKTVLGRCLFGLVEPDAGSVLIDGFEPGESTGEIEKEVETVHTVD